MTRVVCDTNVIVSGLLWKGAPRRVLTHVEQGAALLYTCRELLVELAQVLHYDKLARILVRAELTPDDILTWLVQHAMLVEISPLPHVIVTADPSDDVVVACALAANADVLITGDRHLLQFKTHGRIAVLDAAAWLKTQTNL